MGIIRRLFSFTTILDRYLFQQFTEPFLLAVGAAAFFAIFDILFYLADLTVVSGVSAAVTIRLLLYKLPAVMVLFFPMSVLFSIMLLLVRMAKDNELTILRASGIPTSRILLPLFFMLTLTSIMSYLFNEKIVPWTNQNSENLIRREIQKKAPPTIVENMVFKDQKNRFFYIRKVDQELSEMDDILVLVPSQHFPRTITAKKAYWNETSWTLANGVIQELDRDGVIEFTDHFSEMILHVDENFITSYSRQKTSREMDSRELKDKIDTLNKGGISTRGLRVEYHMKKSIPASCFVFGLIGIGFCINFVRSGKDWWGVIIAIGLAVISSGMFIFMIAFSRSLAKAGTLPPELGAWLPNLVYGAVALISVIWNSVRR